MRFWSPFREKKTAGQWEKIKDKMVQLKPGAKSRLPDVPLPLLSALC